MHSSVRNPIDAQIEALGTWFHNVHLPDGTQTAPGHVLGDFPANKWRRVASAVPEDLTGWSVLDIGCNGGFYSIELAKRGARVTGVDVEPMYLRQAEWTVRQFGLEEQVRFIEGSVYDLIHHRAVYDLVWFTGVFYHLRYPLLALDLVRRLARRRMMFQSMTMPGEHVTATPLDLPLDERARMMAPGWPKMAFIEHRVAGDETNWWAPNHACIEALLRSAGFKVLGRPEHEFYWCEPEAAKANPGFSRYLESVEQGAGSVAPRAGRQ